MGAAKGGGFLSTSIILVLFILLVIVSCVGLLCL